MNFVCACWILFRSSSFSTAWLLIKRYFFLDPGGSESLPIWLTALPVALLVFEFVSRRIKVREVVCNFRLPVFSFTYGAIWSFGVAMLPFGYRPFIYFQF